MQVEFSGIPKKGLAGNQTASRNSQGSGDHGVEIRFAFARPWV
jgi:hypothetical protein